MPARSGRHGAQLPYRLLAGVVPCAGGWLVATGRLQGINLFPQEPEILGTILDVLDYKPAFDVIALAMPIGLPAEPTPKGRSADREARRLLGRHRGAAIMSAPARPALKHTGPHEFVEAYRANGGMSAVVWARLPKIAEIDAEVQPYWQRTVFEVHPELSFYQLNGDQPLTYSKRTTLGQKERTELLDARMQGIDKVLDAHLPRVRKPQLIDAAACLWTSRRIAARAVSRLPEDPEWDDMGLRMEIVR
jgi:predicted RNase H-like nuclease